MTETRKHTLALFYCQNIPESGEEHRQALEGLYQGSIRLFPIPCGGRLEPLHLIRALEEFADAAYVITCPEGDCHYFEGNVRARQRVARTRQGIAGIGLEGERVGIVTTLKEAPKGLADLTAEIMKKISELPLSPVFGNSSSPQRQ